jgi:hypothetical protein
VTPLFFHDDVSFLQVEPRSEGTSLVSHHQRLADESSDNTPTEIESDDLDQAETQMF